VNPGLTTEGEEICAKEGTLFYSRELPAPVTSEELLRRLREWTFVLDPVATDPIVKPASVVLAIPRRAGTLDRGIALAANRAARAPLGGLGQEIQLERRHRIGPLLHRKPFGAWSEGPGEEYEESRERRFLEHHVLRDEF
jgi:hypothetical protein